MPEHLHIRVTSFICISLSIFFVPWWIFLPIVFVYTIYYTPAVETIAFGFLADQVYGASYTYTLLSTLLFMSIYFIRSRIRV